MNDFYKNVGAQLTSIILAGIAAALITFFQSVIVQSGACNIPINSVENAGVLGIMLKGLHTGMKGIKSIV